MAGATGSVCGSASSAPDPRSLGSPSSSIAESRSAKKLGGSQAAIQTMSAYAFTCLQVGPLDPRHRTHLGLMKLLLGWR